MHKHILVRKLIDLNSWSESPKK